MQPNKNKKPNINIFRLIIFLIVIVLAIVILYNIFGPKTQVRSLDYLLDRLQKAQDGEASFAFSNINFNAGNWKITVYEAELANGVPTIKEYVVNATPSYMNDLIAKFAPGGVYDKAFNYSPEIGKIFQDANIKYGVYEWAAAPTRNWWEYITPWILPILMIGMSWFIFRSFMKNSGNGGGLFNPGKNQAIKVISNKKFSDVAGNREVKEEVMELVDYLKHPKKYAAAGARIPKGILLGGPPGTGKTLIAKATAGEANVPFFFISASNFVEMYVGVGAKRVRELFKDARAAAPAIIFIDELDAVGRSRGSGIGGGNDEREQTLNQLLVEMDGMTENSGLLVIAATNRTDVLDPALQRPGRFDRTITVNYPDIKEREEILELHARGKRVSSTIDFKNIAKRTPGFSGAQLENVINEASLLSVRENTEVITAAQIDEAIDRVMSGPAKKNRTITEAERTMVAYHEAGHAVVGIKTPGGNKVQKITIIPRGNAGGYNLMLPEEEKYNATKSELLAMIASFMGGRAAEEILYGKNEISTGAANDIEKATKIARRMVTEFGMSSLGPIQYEENTSSPFLGRDYAKNMSFSHQVGHEIDIEVRKIISEAYDKAFKTIKENMELLELIKTSLLEKETIVSEEIEYIAKHLELPPKEEEKTIENGKKNKNLDELIKETIEEEKEESQDLELN